MNAKTITMILEKTDSGFSAYASDLPIFTTARNMTELLANAYEAVGLYYEENPSDIPALDIKFEIDFKQFFQYYRVINSKFLAERIGMNPTLLSQYVQGRKKPSEEQKSRILTGIQQIGRELAELNLIL